ncbi:MAG TPA: hypothetical protein VII52_05225, partial [Gemmatimonadaceae bacterium]
ARSRFPPTGFQFATSPPQQGLHGARAPMTGLEAMSPRRAMIGYRSGQILERRCVEGTARAR